VTELSIFPDAEQRNSLDPKRPVVEAKLTGVGLLRHGTSEGKASIAMFVMLPDGTQVLAQTTWAAFHTAAKALAASPIAAEETTFD
jgi:hypothetical protein